MTDTDRKFRPFPYYLPEWLCVAVTLTTGSILRGFLAGLSAIAAKFVWTVASGAVAGYRSAR